MIQGLSLRPGERQGRFWEGLCIFWPTTQFPPVLPVDSGWGRGWGYSLEIKPDTGSLPNPLAVPSHLQSQTSYWQSREVGFRFHQKRGPYHCSWNPDSGMTPVSCLGVISLVLNTGAPARSRVLSPNRFAPLPRVLGPSVLASVFKGYGVEAERSRSPSVKRQLTQE